MKLTKTQSEAIALLICVLGLWLIINLFFVDMKEELIRCQETNDNPKYKNCLKLPNECFFD